ncbi:bacillithiol system redox-active protein YtxJ [Metabacillus sp. GX 13764]|uniref:bacillithiol system redox-active protein YtxJ n=1 Tax=Metabacillus kandeliae TaxID=2900151 RepID=UPI001E2DAA1C|nr:bacillithiol system redox-active protein YtxJ [Metabacillus kandeliae]MCD7032730.1 bacillithiol system redox-active protein YtxJ [Metabacillus kandeliae]
MSAANIHTTEEFEKIVNENPRFLLIKNSLTCPISKAAFNEYEAFTRDNQDVQTYYLHVQESRELSNYIAEKFGVKHETPQALLFDQKSVVWNASHWKITKDSLKSAIQS